MLLDNKYNGLYGNYTNAFSRAQSNQSSDLKLRNNKYKGLYGNCMIALPRLHFESVSSCDVITNRRVYMTIFQIHCLEQIKGTYVVICNRSIRIAWTDNIRINSGEALN